MTLAFLALVGAIGGVAMRAADKPPPVPETSESSWDIRLPRTHFDVASWEPDSGLPQNTVRAVIQTRDGHIWVGTSEGLARFNGSEFTVFSRRNTKNFPSSPITALAEAPDGSLWVGSDGSGVAHLKDGAMTRYSTQAGLLSTHVHALTFDGEGSLWIATTSGMNRFKDGKISRFTEREGLVRNMSRSLHRARSGEIWVGTSRGLSLLKGETFTTDESIQRLGSKVIRVLYEAADGTRWIATSSEVARQKDGVLKRYTIKHGIAGHTVEAILQDRSGTVWFGTSAGLVRFTGEKFVTEPLRGTSEKESIRALHEDREGNLWLGTNDGLLRVRRTAFSTIGIAEGLSHNMVSAVCQDLTGAFWVGTMGGGLTHLNGRARTVYLRKHGLISDGIRALQVARDGALWVGFDQSGLVRIKDGEVTQYKDEAVFKGSTVQALHEDRNGTLWIGLRSGLCWLRDGKLENLTKRAGLAGTIIRAFAEDADGAIWIATNRGLGRYHEGKFTTVGKEQGLTAESITALHLDAEGRLWIGSNNAGLNWLKDGRVGSYTRKQGLFSETILELIGDDAGYLWATTRQGIFRVSKQELQEMSRGERPKVECLGFGKGDGLAGVEGSSVAKPGVWKSPDGRLWFATVKSLAVVDPALVTLNTVPPLVTISRVRVNGVDVPLSATIRVPPGRGELEITYAALSYAQPEKVRYKYKLDGMNMKFVDAGARTVANFSGVSPGARRFRVRAMNNHGVWNETGATQRFYFAPHFYQTWSFYTAAGLLVISATYGGFWLRVRTLRGRERRLVALVQERTSHLETEINERKRTQDALQHSESLYHSLVEVLPVSIYRKDSAGRFTFANQHYCRRLGRPRDEVVGKLESDVFSSAVAHKHRAGDAEVRLTRAVVQAEEVEVEANGDKRWFDTIKVPVLDAAGALIGTQGLSWDITPRKRAEQQVMEAQRELLEVSRLAGMAEVATGVLHNVGNVLNSVNVSATVVVDRMRRSKTGKLGDLAEMLREHQGDLAAFMTTDQRGARIPGYLATLAKHVAADEAAIVAELEQLRKNIDHIKSIVAMQQSFAKVSGVTETLAVAEVVEDALRINSTALTRHRIEVVRDFQAVPALTMEKHKVMQVLVNLIENAKHACTDAGRTDPTIKVSVTNAESSVWVSVTDNGVGIAPENLTRIFAHGFTTRKHGHGFGLHSSALVAKELGGRLTARSEGVGRGAEFILELRVERGSAKAATTAAG